ncbi:MAG: transaldolase [Thermodesulfobacteriota bacterium]
MTRIQKLSKLNQSIWFDYIERSLLTRGGLSRLLDQGVTGVTSNPSIFEKAITQSEDYDSEIAEMAEKGMSAREIYEALALGDIAAAADLLRPVYDRTEGRDGFVSLEVDPAIAFYPEKTVSEAIRLFCRLGRPNVMIKVPATQAGINAASSLIEAGVNVNLTLIFSVVQYVQAAEAYLSGLFRLFVKGPGVPGGLPGNRVASVASVFISRTDSLLDPILVEKGRSDLQSRMAISTAKSVYAHFRDLFSGPSWESFAKRGARVQRPLWASTSTKNPALSDTLYVDRLIGPDTVNTLPPATLEAFLDHGTVSPALTRGLDEAAQLLAEAAHLGIDLSFAMEKLQQDGLAAFARSFSSLLIGISRKAEALLAEKKCA